MVGTARFELATPCTPSKCATRLRYVPNPLPMTAWGSTSKFYTRRQPRARARSRIEEDPPKAGTKLCHKQA
jgi:hypothetical protein